MADSSSIEWTDATWNPTRGCSKVSAGCTHCYAERMAARFSKPGEAFDGTITGKHWSGVVKLVPEALAIPLRWKRPRRIFVDSMSDLFHDGVPDEYIAAVFGVMALAYWHTFQVLTKRGDRLYRWFAKYGTHDVPTHAMLRHALDMLRQHAPGVYNKSARDEVPRWPLPNVWLGVSVEDQRAADERIPLLLQCPAAVRFLSCEPLLGPVDLTPWIDEDENGFEWRDGDAVQWVIVGGESGPKSRPCDVAWVESLIEQCGVHSVACFVKQLGAEPIGMGGVFPIRLKDRKGGDPAEWPESLRVRQFPETRRT